MAVPMNPSLLDFAALQTVLGCARRADVERYLNRAGIRYFPSRDGVWTTLDLVNAAGGLTRENTNQPYSSDIL